MDALGRDLEVYIGATPGRTVAETAVTSTYQDGVGCAPRTAKVNFVAGVGLLRYAVGRSAWSATEGLIWTYRTKRK